MFLAQKPTREEQKLKTLTKYIDKYPSGWKKRLELADLLYGMGKWLEAVTQYRQVIERQPQLIPVRLKLGKILYLMGKETEAIELYESSLSLISNFQNSSATSSNINNSYVAIKYHLTGLIEVCQHNLPQAIEAFSSATTLEPDNPCHWLALGQVYLQMGNKIDALKAFETILSRYPDDTIALINIYDVLMALAKANSPLPSNLDYLNLETEDKADKNPNTDSIENIWYHQAGKILDQAVALTSNNYQILKRQIEYRCLSHLVGGKEGKQTKKLLKALLKIAPNSQDAYQLKSYYDQVMNKSTPSELNCLVAKG